VRPVACVLAANPCREVAKRGGLPAGAMTRRARENEAEADREEARQPAAGLQGHRGNREPQSGLANPYQNLLGRLSARDQRLLDRLPLVPPASSTAGVAAVCGTPHL
jgi:hypothetical protein